MEKISYRIFIESINKDSAYIKYKDAIVSSSKFIKDINDELITIEEGYYIYCFYHGEIKDLEYLAIQNNKNIKGKIDIEHDYFSGDFLLNDLSRDMANNSINSLDGYNIFNMSDVIKCEKFFINSIISKGEEMICKRHRVLLTNKDNKVDVVPIREFKVFNKDFYLEKVYKIHYVSKFKKKNYVSIISGVTGRVYELSYIINEEYKEFLKKYKNPIVYIPNFLKEDYYEKCYKIYLKTKEELRFLSEKELYKKIKDNIENNNHPNHEEYLLEGIFYFKKRGYLKYYNVIETNRLRITLLDLYLGLNYQNLCGYKLAEYYKLGIILGDNKDRIKMLETSCRLGNVAAKKLLYEHYLEPKYYDEYYLKRYS